MRTLETNRLILRDWNETDIGNCDVYSDDIIQYLLSAKNNYAVVLKDSNKVIGSIGLNEDAENSQLRRNIGFSLLEQFRNKGYMSEALDIVIKTAKEITPCLSYAHNVNDLRSKHIAEKFGFVYIKTIFGVKRNPDEEAVDFMYYILEL